MIPYEELERALARWKSRHAGGAVESSEPLSSDETADRTPPPPVAAMAAVESIQVHDSTGELELSDAEVDEA